MAKYFSMAEMLASNDACRYNIPNKPGSNEIRNLQWLMDECLDKIRQAWGQPIIVDSGYRSLALNKVVGGAPNSQHTKGEAADIKAINVADNQKLFECILQCGVAFDQVIDEYHYRWIHISCKYQNYGNRRKINHLG
jgi:zinc D-Ala-D-Ala carboxypeptidase